MASPPEHDPLDEAVYQPPAITWEEDFEPAGATTGCTYYENDCEAGTQD